MHRPRPFDSRFARPIACIVPLLAAMIISPSAAGRDDFFFFWVGTPQQVNETLVNPFTGESVVIDGVLRVGTQVYNGVPGGFNSITGTNFPDYMRLRCMPDTQCLINITNYFIGDGSDVLNLADAEFAYQSCVVFSGAGDDIIWTGTGDDFIFGEQGVDIINGGPGDDEIYGDDGDDLIYFGAGMGHDIISGDLGLDRLILTGPIGPADLTITRLPGDPAVRSYEVIVGLPGPRSDGMKLAYVERLVLPDQSVIHLCPADVAPGSPAPDNEVNIDDLLVVINHWGGNGIADIDVDGTVNIQDLLGVITNWGPCP